MSNRNLAPTGFYSENKITREDLKKLGFTNKTMQDDALKFANELVRSRIDKETVLAGMEKIYKKGKESPADIIVVSVAIGFSNMIPDIIGRIDEINKKFGKYGSQKLAGEIDDYFKVPRRVTCVSLPVNTREGKAKNIDVVKQEMIDEINKLPEELTRFGKPLFDITFISSCIQPEISVVHDIGER